MHPQHPMHPLNNGQSAMGGCLPCAGLGARQPEPPWYKNPLLLILGGVGLFMLFTSQPR